jgi:hypothetical protein
MNDMRSSWSGMLTEIQTAANLLPECKFRHIRRGQNTVAHNLVQKVIRHQECVAMRFDVPPCIQELINAEATSRESTSQIIGLGFD